MIYQLGEKDLIPNKHAAECSKKLGVFSYQDASGHCTEFGLKEQMVNRVLLNPVTRFESHENLDMICIPIADFAELEKDKSTIHWFIAGDHCFIVCDQIPLVTHMLRIISEETEIPITAGRLLYYFLDLIFSDDKGYLDQLEDEITELEKQVMTDKNSRDYMNQILVIKKKLMILRKYYAALDDIFDYIVLNENNLFDKDSLRYLKLLDGRTNRLAESVNSMMEYVTQIREAYQANVDISLNLTMRLFTVVTTIFLPLTLIVGWYGMNLNMPEMNHPITYPVVIFLSILIVILSIFFFKKKKWF